MGITLLTPLLLALPLIKTHTLLVVSIGMLCGAIVNEEDIDYIVKHLVDKPEEVKVKEVTSEHMNVYEVHVNRRDFGKVIGKRGEHAQALRWLLSAAAKKSRKKVMLKILE
jgi:predicted RNA-binding protein YlqC (UPF0109 family)